MSDKIDDTLDAFESLLPNVGKELRHQVKIWVDANLTQAKDSIELGGRLHSDSEKARRRAVRAHVLATQGLGLKVPGKSIPTLRDELVKLDLDALKRRLQDDIEPYVMDPRTAQRMVFGWSFRSPGTATLRDKLRYSWGRLGEVMKKAVSDVASVTSPKKVTAQYTAYFGMYSADRAKQALDTLSQILVQSQTQPLWLYYRGQSLKPHSVYSDWPFQAGEIGGLCSEDCVGASIKPEQKKLGLRPYLNPLQKGDEGLHVKIGKGSEGKSDSEILHTLIHELSHFTAGTRDVKAPGIVLEALSGAKLTIPQQMVAMNSYITKNSGDGYALIQREEFLERTGKTDKLPASHVPTTKPKMNRRDVVDSYGADVCKALAENFPDKAVCNADSVAYYCMQFA